MKTFNAQSIPIENNKGSKKSLYISALSLYLWCLPLNAISLGAMGSVLKYIAIIPVLIAFISLKYIRINKLVILQSAFILYAAISYLWSVNDSMSVDRIITYVLLSMLIFSGNIYEYSTGDINKIKNAFMWSSRTTALVMLIFSRYSGGRFFLSGMITEDPNYLCGYLIAGIILTIQKIQTHSRKKILSIIELVIYMILIIETGSRGGLIAVVVSVLAYILFSKRLTASEFIKKSFAIIGIVIGFIIVLRFFPQELRDRFNLGDAISTGGTGRFNIWQQGFDLFDESPFLRKFFGYGTGTISLILTVIEYGIARHAVMHNILLETLVELGVLGLIIYVLTILGFVKASFKDSDKFAFAVIIGMVVLSLSTSLHTFKPYFDIMLFIIILSGQKSQISTKEGVPNGIFRSDIQ